MHDVDKLSQVLTLAKDIEPRCGSRISSTRVQFRKLKVTDIVNWSHVSETSYS